MQASAVLLFCREAPASEEQFNGCEAYGVVKSSGEYVLNIGNKNEKRRHLFFRKSAENKTTPPLD